MKKLLLTLLMMCTMTCTTFASDIITKTKDQIVFVNNENISFSRPVININGHNYFPMRELLNQLGVTDDNIKWDNNTKTVTVNAITKFSFSINSNNYTVNGTRVAMDNKAIIYNNQTYLPIRNVCDALGANVLYVGETKSTSVVNDFGGLKGFNITTGNQWTSIISDSLKTQTKLMSSMLVECDNYFTGLGMLSYAFNANNGNDNIVAGLIKKDDSNITMNNSSKTSEVNDDILTTVLNLTNTAVSKPTELQSFGKNKFFVTEITSSKYAEKAYLCIRYEQGYVSVVTYIYQKDKPVKLNEFQDVLKTYKLN